MSDDTISALWRFAGYGTVDVKVERAVEGESYRVVYDNAKKEWNEEGVER